MKKKSTQYAIKNLKVISLNETAGKEKVKFNSSDSINKVWGDVRESSWYDEEKECVVVFSLNTKLEVKGFFLVSLGTLNESLVHPREIFKPLIADSAYAFVLSHNHPSGDPYPSEADRRFTRRIKEVADLLQISLLDHIVVGGENANGYKYFSFKESGLV